MMKFIRTSHMFSLVMFVMIIGIMFVCGIKVLKGEGTIYKNVNEGDIWVKEYDKDNPFENATPDTVYVIEIKGDYVKYKRNGVIRSCQKRWISINARKIN